MVDGELISCHRPNFDLPSDGRVPVKFNVLVLLVPTIILTNLGRFDSHTESTWRRKLCCVAVVSTAVCALFSLLQLKEPCVSLG